ncbi:unnamed protein product [Adineta steineri]|uniref:Uncharacterized protein n=2 Tax=Adineta steineri TaxID=433720 RepID=A0A814FAC0_9BILA|nr:unnamed protein product [Adineta steineri]
MGNNLPHQGDGSEFSNEELSCKGRVCRKCGWCRDWYWTPGWLYGTNYIKRADATCTYFTYIDAPGYDPNGHVSGPVTITDQGVDEGFFSSYANDGIDRCRHLSFGQYLAYKSGVPALSIRLCGCEDNRA